MAHQRLATTLCGLHLRNPVLAASGTFGYGIEFARILDLNQLGAIVTKGLSREPIAGNPAPRLWNTAAGMINSVGLQNVGIFRFTREKLPLLRRYSVPVFANVFGFCSDDYVEVIQALEDADGIAAYELNVSCPNTESGGIFFSNDRAALSALVRRARALTTRPLVVKLSPNVSDIVSIAQAAEQSGADCLSLVNTFLALAIDANAAASRIGAGFGGLSGPAIRSIALRMVYEVARAVTIPVIGMGGIATGTDAAEFLLAGARAVQVGTATFADPCAPLRVANQLERWAARRHIGNIGEIVGKLAVKRTVSSGFVSDPIARI